MSNDVPNHGTDTIREMRVELDDKTARLLTIREGLADLMAKVYAALPPPVHPAYAKDDPIFNRANFCKHDVFRGGANPDNPCRECIANADLGTSTYRLNEGAGERIERLEGMVTALTMDLAHCMAGDTAHVYETSPNGVCVICGTAQQAESS